MGCVESASGGDGGGGGWGGVDGGGCEEVVESGSVGGAEIETERNGENMDLLFGVCSGMQWGVFWSWVWYSSSEESWWIRDCCCSWKSCFTETRAGKKPNFFIVWLAVQSIYCVAFFGLINLFYRLK